MKPRTNTVLKTEWFTVEEEQFDHIESLQGKPFYRLKTSDGAMILALTEKGEMVLIRQFRPALNERTLELPAGMVQPGEDPAVAAARELYEETGYVCESMEFLGKGGVMMHRTNSKQSAFLARGVKLDPNFKPQEDIEVLLVSPAEFKDLVVSGEFQQLAAIALPILADWKFCTQFLVPEQSNTGKSA